MQSKTFRFILAHQPDFIKIALPDNAIFPDILTITDETKLGAILSNIVFESFFRATGTKNKALFDEVLDNASHIQHTSLKFPYTLFAFSLQFYATTKDTSAIIREARPVLEKIMKMDAAVLEKYNNDTYEALLYPYVTGQSDSTKVGDFEAKKVLWRKNFSNYLATMLYTGADRYLAFAQSGNDLKAAINWCKRALQIGDKKPEYLNTLALLYYKTGQQKKAFKKQEEALSAAQQLNAPEKVLEKYQTDLDRIKMRK
jgi:predicted O-linked N-acetylglucosamine transferase (SPINDLY family)